MRLMRRMKSKYGITHPLCLLSILACVCFCTIIILHTFLRYADSTTDTFNYVNGDVDVREVMAFLEEISDTIIRSYSQVIAIGIEPVLAVLLEGGAGLTNAVMGMPLDISSTMFSVPHVLLITLAVFMLGKLMQCFEFTRSVGMLIYGEAERIFGYVVMVAISCQNIVKIMYVCEKHSATLESVLRFENTEVLQGIVVFVLGAGSAFVGLVVYYVIKTLVLGLQIMQLSVSFFPFTSLLFEVVRSSFVVIIAVFNLLFPRVGLAFNVAMLLLGALALAQTSGSVEYFRVIYFESLIIPFYRFRGETIKLYKDVPREIKKHCNREKCGIIVPVFSTGRFVLEGQTVSNHEKWWMEICEKELRFYRKKFMVGKIEQINIPLDGLKWYFRENPRCMELFVLDGPQENIIRLFKKPQKHVTFVISREYETIFSNMVSAMHAVDYEALKAQMLQERKEYIKRENKAYYALTQ